MLFRLNKPDYNVFEMLQLAVQSALQTSMVNLDKLLRLAAGRLATERSGRQCSSAEKIDLPAACR